MKLLTEEQIREIEQREFEKRIQKELEQQHLREIEMKRKEEERKAREIYFNQLRESHEPVISLIESLNETNYLILQYQNPNGSIKTYKFKTKEDSKLNDYWMTYDSEFNIYVTNGFNKSPVIFQNILGCEIREEEIAEVVMIGGVVYKRMIVESDKIDMIMQDKSVMSYKGDFS